MYELKGCRRLMAAVLIRAVRDVYAQEKYIRNDATGWLQDHGLEYVVKSGIQVSQVRIHRWIDGGFDRSLVDLDWKIPNINKELVHSRKEIKNGD